MYSFNKYFFIYSIFTIMPILILMSFTFLFSTRGKLCYLLSLDLFISVLFITDMVYARAFNHLISIYMIFAKGVTEDLGLSILSLIKWTDFLMLIDLPFIFIWGTKRIHVDIANSPKKILQFSTALFLSSSLMVGQFLIMENNKLLADVKFMPILLSPLGMHMFDIYRFIYEKTDELDSEDIAKVEKWLEANARYQAPSQMNTQLRGLLKGKNIIVVQFESLENVLLSQSYFGQEITPNVNRLINSSIFFNNIYEQVRDGNSSDAELLFNASIYPISTGSSFLRFGDNAYTTLPHLLDENGYTSVAIHGDNKEYWNRHRVFQAMGFDQYIAETEFSDKTYGGMGILDEALFAQSYKEIAKLRAPYYSFIITLTSHMPFKAAQKIGTLDLPNDDETARYLQTIHYADKYFGEFYNNLKKDGYLTNSAVIIYGDHEGVHKYYSTNLPDNGKKIPFIIHVPDMEGLVVDKIGGQIDMMPTLVYLLGIDEGEYSTGIMGRNLFGHYAGAAVLSDGRIIGQPDNEEHLRKAQGIADIIIRGNYFGIHRYRNPQGQRN
jgi:lipoteichoic acid synthase